MGAASRTEVIIMSRNGEKSRGDLYARITDRIIAELERGVRGRREYVGPHHPTTRHNGQPYTGINVVLLWSEAARRLDGVLRPLVRSHSDAADRKYSRHGLLCRRQSP